LAFGFREPSGNRRLKQVAADLMGIAADEGTALLAQGKVHGTNVQQTANNMINCFIGAGILTVPYAFRLTGYGAVLGLVLVAVLNWITSLLLGRALEKAAKLEPEQPLSSWDLPALGRVCFGKFAQHGIAVVFALELWFALETFIVLTGINVSIVTGAPRTPVIIIAGILGTMSLSLPMDVIAGFSFLSVWCMFGGLVALFVCGTLSPQTSPKHVLLEVSALPSSIGMFLYCFSGLPCLPNIRASMQNTSNYSHAVHLAFTFAVIYYTVVGLAGYHFYAEATRESFTENLMPAWPVTHGLTYGFGLLSAALFAAKLQAGFPLYAAPVLQSFGFGSEREECSRGRREVFMARVLFAAVSVGFAVLAQDALDAVAELMGSFLTNFTSIIFPCAAYVAICHASGERIGIARGLGLLVLGLFGIGFSVVGTISACRRFMAEEAAVGRL